jgi:hypothetical protein
MKPQDKVALGLITVIALCLFGFALSLVPRAWGFLVEIFDSEVGRMVLVGYAVLFLSSLTIARGLTRRAVRDLQPSAKGELYERILAAWSAAHRRGDYPGGIEFEELERHLVLHASQGVLNGYFALCKLDGGMDPSVATTRAALQRLIREMRKDLGRRDPPWPSPALDLVFQRGETPAEKNAGQPEVYRVKPSATVSHFKSSTRTWETF